MEKIASFQIDHLALRSGIYLSRRDVRDGVAVTTFDLRITEPNREPAADIAALHTIEHLGATFLRGSKRGSEIVYFGPMGCRTGCYLLMFGELEPSDVFDLVKDMCEFILNFEGEIPGAKAEECGNFLEHNLPMAKYYIRIFKERLEKYRRMSYCTEPK